jgi:methylase of polypeptide subunit release factors
MLMFEFGLGLDEPVEELIRQTPGLTLVELRRDLQGIPRVAIARRTAGGG